MKTEARRSDRAGTPEELVAHLRSLVVEAEKLMGDAPGESQAEAVKSLRERFDAARERLAALYANAKERMKGGAHCADDAIRANPYQAIAISMGSGLLVGLLMGRCGCCRGRDRKRAENSPQIAV